MMIKQDNETTPVINEYDLFNGGFDLRYFKNKIKEFIYLNLSVVMNQFHQEIIFGKLAVLYEIICNILCILVDVPVKMFSK